MIREASSCLSIFAWNEFLYHTYNTGMIPLSNRSALMSRLNALVCGLEIVFDEAWGNMCRGALGSSLWLNRRHSRAVFEGFVMAFG